MSVLEARGIEKSFGGLTALSGADLVIERDDLVGLIGPNGAGKTTLFDCLSGTLTPDTGRVYFCGRDVTDLPTYRRARLGLVRTFQQTRELATMTVAENVRLPAPSHPGERAVHALARTDAALAREAEVDERAAELLDFFELDGLADEYAGTLSGGQRKLLEVARALMLDPEVLLLDEPFAGVNPTLTASITRYIEELNDDGVTVLIIEHEIATLAELVDRLIVLDRGTVLTDGDPRAVLDDDRVIDTYLGERVE